MSGRYQIVSLRNKDDLVALFCSAVPNASKEYIQAKPQIEFLHQYCIRAGVQTLILEAPYIDRHYSEDYSGYYVKCHSEYPKVCARLHFFRDKITAAEMKAFFDLGQSALDFNSRGYCGFVIAKPLPKTMIGRTCLAPLPDPAGKGQEFFLTRRGHEPSLFGVRLKLKSLPFQEQDHEVGACATTAMWTALYATAHIFDTPVLSPLQITKKAFISRPLPEVSLPSDGLQIEQMAGVFQSIGLEADYRQAKTRLHVQTFAAAYLRARIPVVLSFDFALAPNATSELHGVALTGFGPMSGKLEPSTSGILLRASRIQKFYAHDDGVGPYSEIDLRSNKRLLTGWWENGKRLLAKPEALLVPLYHKIRIFYQDVSTAIVILDAIIEHLRTKNILPLPERLEWDIYLTSAADYKQDVSKRTITSEIREELLVQGFPHFFWRSIAYTNGKPVVEFLVDATDLRQGRQLMAMIFYDKNFRVTLSTVLPHLRLSDDVTHLAEIMLSAIQGARRPVTILTN